MKICTIDIENYSDKIPNIKLNFLKEDETPYDTIIFIGENGTFKTSILNLIFSIFNGGYGKKECTSIVTFMLEKEENENFKKEIVNYINSENLEFCLEKYSLTKEGGRYKLLGHNNRLLLEGHDILSRDMFKVIFSEALSNFENQRIDHTTNQTIDKSMKSRKTSNSLAKEIKQLLVDINIQDNQEIAQEVDDATKNKASEDIFYKISKKERRFSRFSKAFNNFFEGKEITKTGNSLDIIFKEGDKVFGIDELSSGEKQIVFRGSFLLKDKNVEKGSVILIDEPEISMHPNWQIKILTFFREIFTENNKQKSQIFIATHSPYILQNSRDCCVIVLKKIGEQLEIERKNGFYGWTPDQITEKVFGLQLRPKEVIAKLSYFKELLKESYESKDKEKKFLEAYKDLISFLKDDDYELISKNIFDLNQKINKEIDEKNQKRSSTQHY
jgi:predicted ATPase